MENTAHQTPSHIKDIIRFEEWKVREIYEDFPGELWLCGESSYPIQGKGLKGASPLILSRERSFIGTREQLGKHTGLLSGPTPLCHPGCQRMKPGLLADVAAKQRRTAPAWGLVFTPRSWAKTRWFIWQLWVGSSGVLSNRVTKVREVPFSRG